MSFGAEQIMCSNMLCQIWLRLVMCMSCASESSDMKFVGQNSSKEHTLLILHSFTFSNRLVWVMVVSITYWFVYILGIKTNQNITSKYEQSEQDYSTSLLESNYELE